MVLLGQALQGSGKMKPLKQPDACTGSMGLGHL